MQKSLSLVFCFLLLYSLLTSSGYADQVYVSKFRSGHIAVIDTTYDDEQTTITGLTGCQTTGIAISPDQSKSYVTNYACASLAVIDNQAQKTIDTIVVGLNPVDVLVSKDGKTIYVVNSGSNSISVIDALSRTSITTIGVGFKPSGIAITPDEKRLYVTNYNSHNISIIDTQTYRTVDEVSHFQHPIGIAITPDGSKAYVVDSGSNSVCVLNMADNSIIKLIKGFTSPYGVAISVSKQEVYVTNYGSNSVSVIDMTTNKIVDHITVGSSPVRVAITPDDLTAYVTNYHSDTVSVIDMRTRSVSRNIAVNWKPMSLAILFSPVESGFDAEEIAVLDEDTQQKIQHVLTEPTDVYVLQVDYANSSLIETDTLLESLVSSEHMEPMDSSSIFSSVEKRVGDHKIEELLQSSLTESMDIYVIEVNRANGSVSETDTFLESVFHIISVEYIDALKKAQLSRKNQPGSQNLIQSSSGLYRKSPKKHF